MNCLIYLSVYWAVEVGSAPGSFLLRFSFVVIKNSTEATPQVLLLKHIVRYITAFEFTVLFIPFRNCRQTQVYILSV